MGKATRVRVIFEYRNGDGHFLSRYQGAFVVTKDEHDLSATDAAYLSAVQSKEQQRLMLEDREPAHHD